MKFNPNKKYKNNKHLNTQVIEVTFVLMNETY